MNDFKILFDLKKLFGEEICNFSPFPKSFPDEINKPKAILLGCDPTNTYYNFRFRYVFSLGTNVDLEGRNIEGFQKRFLPKWNNSLKSIKLSFENVYTQNICRNYFKKETRNNPVWDETAIYWIPYLYEELKKIDKQVPVLMSSERIYKVLMNNEETIHYAKDFYKNPDLIPIAPNINKLKRPLIPFYRHKDYSILLDKWNLYRQRITDILN